MDMSRQQSVFNERCTMQNEVYNLLLECASNVFNNIIPFDGKVLNKRIEKLFKQGDNFTCHLSQSKYTFNYSPVISFRCSLGKYRESYLYYDFEVELCTNEQNRLDMAKTLENYENFKLDIWNKIEENNNAMKNFVACTNEFQQIKQMFKDWQNKYGYIERNGNYMKIVETIY